MQAALGRAVITPRYRCLAVTSSISFASALQRKFIHFAVPAPPRKSMICMETFYWRIPQGSPSSLWEGVSKFHYPPRCHRARFAESGLRLRRSLGWLVRKYSEQATVLAARLMPLSRGFCACIMVYSVFNVQRKASWRMSLHLSPILGHFCTLFSAIREKFFHFLHRRADALGNILMADTLGACA